MSKAVATANARPIIIRRIKKVSGGHHGGAWKVAYADFVTAMMAFFMLLWLISNPDKEKLKGLAEYFSPSPPSAPAASGQTSGKTSVTAAGGHTMRDKTDAREGGGEPAMLAASAGVARGGSADIPDAALRAIGEEMRLALEAIPTDESTPAMVETEGDVLRVSLADSLQKSMFQDGSARLNAHGQRVLAQVATVLAPLDHRISIEGHTAGGGDGWGLSAARAASARSTLIGSGVKAPRIIRLSAMADSQPVWPGQPQRAENRRVVIVIHAGPQPLPDNASLRF